MRTTLSLGFALILTLPALAQEATLFEQYQASNLAFAANAEGAAEYLENYQAQVMDGLDGRWFLIGTVMPESEDPKLFAQICIQVGTDIAVRDNFTIAFTIASGQDTAVTTLYTARGGNVFSSYTDATAMLNRLGMDESDADPSTIRNLLDNTNGIATLHRPSPDILVVQTNYSVPQIYGRCAR